MQKEKKVGGVNALIHLPEKGAIMRKAAWLALFGLMLCFGSASAGTIAEEHQRAKDGGYEKEYEKSMKEVEGTRTKEEHEKYHQQQEQKNNQTDKEEDYGKTYQEKQLGTENRIRTW